VKTYKISVPATRTVSNSDSFLEGFKEACEANGADFDVVKEAVPLMPLLSAAALLPIGYEAASRGVKSVTDSNNSGKNLLLAGLAGLSAVPFLGSGFKGLGHIGRALKVHSKTGKIPSVTAGLGYSAKEPGKFIKAVRAPHRKGIDLLAKALGKERSARYGDNLLRVGRLGNKQPFRFFDRGLRSGGIAGTLIPSVAGSMGLEYATAPLRGRIYQKLHADAANAKAMKAYGNSLVNAPNPNNSALARFMASMKTDNSLADEIFRGAE